MSLFSWCVNFCGFCNHLDIHKKILPGESTKISAVQLQPFLHNDPFLFKVPPYSLPLDDRSIKVSNISLSFIMETTKESKEFLVSLIPFCI